MNRNATAIILIVLAIGIYFTFTQTVIDEAMVEKSMNDKYVTAIANAVKLIEQRKKVYDDYSAISPESRQRLDRMIPSATNNIHLIVDISELASQYHQIQLKNVRAEVVNSPGVAGIQQPQAQGSPIIAADSLAQVKITFTANATYDQFKLFLRDVQSSLRILDVSHLSIKPTDTGIYEFQVELRAYWLKS